ncbi:holo-ACP synthase [Paenibacillus sp. HJGM_3]|uniref:holo-ACP synthase n=1 Tax=Paenibacillus sp. HJGM_3 TaxID=3379816 RepID=UPI00385C507B
MIIGIGMDLVEIARIRRILEEPHGARFVERVLTPEERERAATRGNRLAEYVAGRFAAKEAVAKALGCGIGRQVGLQDIRVVPDDRGRPCCSVSDAAWARLGYAVAAAGAAADTATATEASPNAGPQPAVRLHLTITHTETTAAAFVVAERDAQ